MTEFCYILDDQKGSRWVLSREGPREEPVEFEHQLDQYRFRHAEDRQIGSCILHVFERTMPATDIVPPEPEWERAI